MALVTTKRNVDVLPGQAAPTVFHCSQHDVGATIILGLVNAGGYYSIPSGVTAIIQGSCSNGAVFTPVTATVSGSDITFNLSAEMTSIAGPTVCEAVLSKDTDVLGTANFILDVEESAMGSDTPPVFTDAAWLWMVDKMGSETVSALGDKTVIDAIESKLDKNQGTANAGKYLKVGADGNVEAAATDTTLSVSGDAADAKAVGDELDDLKADLNYQFEIAVQGKIITSEIEHGSGYSTADGYKNATSSRCCSKTLLKVKDGGHVYVSEIGQDVVITQYDENLIFIDYCRARLMNNHYIYQCTKKATRYIGLTTNEDANLNDIKIRQLDASDIIEYPYLSNEYCYADNRLYSSNGVASSNSSWGCINLCEVKAGDKYYTNAKYEMNFICFDESNTVLANATPYIDIPYGGRIYTIPDGAVYCWVNIQKAKTHGDISVVYYKLTKDEKILAIGDSITWLDGRNGYDNATLFLGWQKQLQKAGYQVESAGFSGYSYATGTRDGSIYTEIVTNQYDVSGFDYIILFGGTNDDLYNVPIGSRYTEYRQTEFDASTFNGALSGIIKYIRDNNPTCKIILCTIIKSEASPRVFTEAITYVNEIKYNAEFWSCYLNNLFSNFNVSPHTDGFDLYYYDNTHPNKAGMKRLGELMLKAVEDC